MKNELTGEWTIILALLILFVALCVSLAVFGSAIVHFFQAWHAASALVSASAALLA